MEAVLQSIANAAGTFCPSHMRYVIVLFPVHVHDGSRTAFISNASSGPRAVEELRQVVDAADKERN